MIVSIIVLFFSAPRVLRPSYKYHMSQNENVYALTIKDLMFEDEGVYTFKFEGQETHCKLKVDGKAFFLFIANELNVA